MPGCVCVMCILCPWVTTMDIGLFFPWPSKTLHGASSEPVLASHLQVSLIRHDNEQNPCAKQPKQVRPRLALFESRCHPIHERSCGGNRCYLPRYGFSTSISGFHSPVR